MSHRRNPALVQQPGVITCPWCGAKMNLKEIGVDGWVRHNALVCARSPADHAIRVDTGPSPKAADAGGCA